MSENSKERGLLRQGDVLLIPVGSVPAGKGCRRENVGRVDGRLVLAEGEATGHAHAIEGDTALLVRVEREAQQGLRRSVDQVGTFLVVKEAEVLRHEEHDPIVVEPGAYEVRRQREYRPQSFVWVAD